jgi:hypothetical protein
LVSVGKAKPAGWLEKVTRSERSSAWHIVFSIRPTPCFRHILNPMDILFPWILLAFQACVPVSYMPPPEHPGMDGREVGLVAFAPSPSTTAFGAQFWYMKRKDPETLYGFRLHNVNTEVISILGGGAFYRHSFRNDEKRYLGWEAEVGSLYLRASMLGAVRKEQFQLYSSPGLQLQPGGLVMLTLPLGATLWSSPGRSLSLELSTSVYLEDLLRWHLPYYRTNPSLGAGFTLKR